MEREDQQLKTHYEAKHSLIYCKTVFQCGLYFSSDLPLFWLKIQGLKLYRHHRQPPFGTFPIVRPGSTQAATLNQINGHRPFTFVGGIAIACFVVDIIGR
jgi:hypothetical protein